MAAIHSGDADLSMIQDREVAVIGFGAEARAHRLPALAAGSEIQAPVADSRPLASPQDVSHSSARVWSPHLLPRLWMHGRRP